MTGQDLRSRRNRPDSDAPGKAGRVTRGMREQQLLHLVRVAWDLNKRGVPTAVDLPLKKEPVLAVPRVTGPLRVMALSQNGTWYFTWGRGEGHRVRALSDDAADRIWEAAQ